MDDVAGTLFYLALLAGPSPDRTLSWLLPLDSDYNPPIGWHDALLYLIVPALTVASQYVSMDILTPPKDPDKVEEKDNSSAGPHISISPPFLAHSFAPPFSRLNLSTLDCGASRDLT